MPEKNYLESMIKKGAEIGFITFCENFGKTLGVEFAKVIISTLFNSNDEEKFEEMVKEIRGIVKQEIDSAFLREHCGKVLGLGENVKTYYTTKDKNVLYPLLNDITQEINTIKQFDSTEALSTLLYAINVYSYTLRALAEYEENYYNVAKTSIKGYLEEVEKKLNVIEANYMNSIPNNVIYNISNKTVGICESEEGKYVPGAKYRLNVAYTDLMTSQVHMLETEVCFPFPKEFGELNTQAEPPDDYFKNHQYVIELEARRNEQKKLRVDTLNNFTQPIKEVVELWHTTADFLERKLEN